MILVKSLIVLFSILLFYYLYNTFIQTTKKCPGIEGFEDHIKVSNPHKNNKSSEIIEEEKLKVTDLEILMDYVASGVEPRGIVLRDDFYDEYRSIAKNEINKKGYFEIIKRSPLYICKKN